MPWGKLDDSLYDHPKLDLLGRDRLAGAGLWAISISWCNKRLTDGFMTAERIRQLGGTVRLADKLVEAGLYEATAEGYHVHDFLDFNDSRADVEAHREADRRKKQAQRSAGSANVGHSANGTFVSPGESPRDTRRDTPRESSGESPATRPVPSRPVPTKRLNSSGRRREPAAQSAAVERWERTG